MPRRMKGELSAATSVSGELNDEDDDFVSCKPIISLPSTHSLSLSRTSRTASTDQKIKARPRSQSQSKGSHSSAPVDRANRYLSMKGRHLNTHVGLTSIPPPSDRKAQNRLAQREFRQRKVQYVKELEARVALVESGGSEQLESYRAGVRALMDENEQLRQLVTSMSGFIVRFIMHIRSTDQTLIQWEI